MNTEIKDINNKQKRILQRDILIMALLFLIAFVWKLAYIGTRDICIDEPFTIFHAQKPFLDILKLPAQNEPNPPFFMLLLHFWIKLFGISPYSVRILPLLFNSITAAMLYLCGKKFFNLWVGLLGAGIFILSTYHFYFGLETRAYALLSMLTAFSLYYFLSLVQKPETKKNVILLILSNVLLIYSHYFGWFVVMVQAAGFLLYIKDRRFIIKLLWVMVFTGIAFIPMAVVVYKQFFISSGGTWVTSPARSEYINQLKHFFNNKFIFRTTICVGIGAFLFFLLKKPERKLDKKIVVVFLWWFLPYTFMFLISKEIPMFINRYVLFNSIGVYLFVGAVLWYFLKSKKYLFPITSFSLIILMATGLEINSGQFYYREVKNAVSKVKELKTPDAAILIHPHWAHLGFLYYYAPEVFKDTKDIDSLMLKNNIFPCWDLNHAKQFALDEHRGKVVYYQDGSIFTDKNNTIYKYLDSTRAKVDSVFYPQCFFVSAFDLK